MKSVLDVAETVLGLFGFNRQQLGVPNRYADAFCGRVPKSILAKHYTYYSPMKLKGIYDNAILKVLY